MDFVVFLGFEINGGSIKPATGMIDKIKNLKEPKNVTDVKSIIGTMQYIRKMIPYFSCGDSSNNYISIYLYMLRL